MDGFGFIVGLIVAAIIGVLIAKDANSRGMNGSGWGIFVFLICIVALPIYLIVRKPVQEE
jgi:F0F1-type ATP synthase assembly protein I